MNSVNFINPTFLDGQSNQESGLLENIYWHNFKSKNLKYA